ncbi:unnamed protein product [Caenorhabditis angaria]|uniref:Uncharacterized protein n=1 Tax=Caenorhabditis angaria TaxID=860376 RepID=A0A9P1N251_9PELO|nr:unnamed protein product [Caenorhabditis angaria]
MRSIMRVQLPKYFRSDIYFMNRCAKADALLIDIERKEFSDDYKIKSINSVLTSKFPLPRILVDPVITHPPNPWIKGLEIYPIIEGHAIRSSTAVEKYGNEDDFHVDLPRTMFTLLWNFKENRYSHTIISYHTVNETDILYNSRLLSAIRRSIESNMKPVAARTCKFKDETSAIHEFQLLREVGITGIVLQNPNLIDITNKIFK